MGKVIFSVLLLFVFLDFSINVVILNRLKVHYANKWRELGEPSLFFNNSIKNSLRFISFKWSAEHNQLKDKLLSNIVLFEKLLSIIYVALFIFLIVVLLKGTVTL